MGDTRTGDAPIGDTSMDDTSIGDDGALVLAGGELEFDGAQNHLIEGEWEHVICADSGAHHALGAGLRPTLLVGDLDSIDPDVCAELGSIPTVTFPSDKEKSDTQLAVEWALMHGAKRIVVAGGIGSRLDHSLANVQLLALIESRGARGVVTDGRQAVYLLTNWLTLTAPKGFVLSVLPLVGTCRGLNERGLRWELTRFDPTLGDTRTLSNEFTDRTAELSLEEGAALVMICPPV